MYSIAQHAVANGYGKIEYFRAQPMARSRRVTTTASAMSASSPVVASRGRGGGRGFAMSELSVSAGLRPVKATRPFAIDEIARYGPARHGHLHALDPSPRARHLDGVGGHRPHALIGPRLRHQAEAGRRARRRRMPAAVSDASSVTTRVTSASGVWSKSRLTTPTPRGGGVSTASGSAAGTR